MERLQRSEKLATGTRIGPYEIVSSLGAGGMGEVYRARDSRLGREVALKVLPAAVSADRDRVKRFEQEAVAAGALSHPNVLSIYDVGKHEGAPYLVSELLEGESLASELAAGRLSVRRALEYAVQIAKGLAAAHERGILHRDLKPSNVFVTPEGHVKILDFGLAKLITSQAERNLTSSPTSGTAPGAVLGTLGYMSPEQLRGQTVDPRGDIFSFGAILYEMVAGRRAFRGESAADVMSAILRDDPPFPVGDRVPSSLQRLMRRCLEKNPAQRYQSARDLAFDLETALRDDERATSEDAHTESFGQPKIVAALVALALGIGYLARAVSAGSR